MGLINLNHYVIVQINMCKRKYNIWNYQSLKSKELYVYNVSPYIG